MKRAILLQTHETYDADLWANYDALYAGGKKFFARIRSFLQQNPQEPPEVYTHRLKEAHYRCYMGGIIDYFASFLFSSPIIVRAKNEKGTKIDLDDFYAEFKEDCDGQDNDLQVFLRARIIEALTKRTSWWLVEKPPAPDAGEEVQSLAEWREAGLDNVRLRALQTEQVLDWEVDDETGELVWAIVQSVRTVRPSPRDMRKLVVERYDIYDRHEVERLELRYEKNKKPTKDVEVPTISRRPHGFSRVPLVVLDVGDPLWVGNRAASPQLEHARLSNALGWGLRRTCYAMPVLHLEDEKKLPTMGAGYYLSLGVNEKFEWAAPPAAPYSVVAEEIKAQKDEIFRVVQQMALGVDNNAAAVGRSAKSKEVDSASVRVVLQALGKLVRERIETTYALMSDGRSESYDWSIEGLDTFDDIDPAMLVEAVTGALLLDIPSPTWNREVKTRVALSTIDDADQAVKDKVRSEIEQNVSDESVLNPPAPPGAEAAAGGFGPPKIGAPKPKPGGATDAAA